MQGIYEIRNQVTGDYYIGRSVSVIGRWQQHMHELEQGRHASKALQADWDEYGPIAFTFKILETIPDMLECMTREAELIQELQPVYNSVGTEHYAKALKKPRPPQPQTTDKPRIRMINGGTVSIEEDELGIWTCPDCGVPFMAARTGSQLTIHEATKFAVLGRFFGLLNNGVFDDRIRGKPKPRVTPSWVLIDQKICEHIHRCGGCKGKASA